MVSSLYPNLSQMRSSLGTQNAAPQGSPTTSLPSHWKELPVTHTLEQRHVVWVHHHIHGHSTIKKTLVVALVCLEALALTVSVVGLIEVCRLYALYNKHIALLRFNKEVEEDELPTASTIAYKTPTQTMNHINEYCIHHELIWCKRIGTPTDSWKPVYCDRSITPQEISVDGKKLAIMDSDRKIHVKNILKETWVGEEYQFTDLSFEHTWTKGWCTIPFLSSVIPSLAHTRLIIPKNHLFAISNRGDFNRFYHDGANRQLPDTSGASSMITYDTQHNQLHIYDVWLPTTVKATIAGPVPDEGSFIPQELSVSASTIAILGQKILPNNESINNQSITTVYTYFCDLDTNGDNPFMRYSYSSKKIAKDTTVLALQRWQESPVEKISFSTKLHHLSIIQTGSGNDQRELRIVKTTTMWKNSTNVLLTKCIRDAHWLTKDHVQIGGDMLSLYSTSPSSQATAWENTDTSLKSFQQEADWLVLTHQGTTYHLKKRNSLLKQWLFHTQPHYDMINPDEETPKAIPVTLVVTEDILIIRSKHKKDGIDWTLVKVT